MTGGRIKFRHVAFGYDPRRPILKDLSFIVEPGKTIAIVAERGGGIHRLAPPALPFLRHDQREILIDGQNIAEVTQIRFAPRSTWCRRIGAVQRHPAYNIAYSRPSANDDEVKEAARMARLSDRKISRLPDGFATRVGERGLKLSGGEKRRVAIARPY